MEETVSKEAINGFYLAAGLKNNVLSGYSNEKRLVLDTLQADTKEELEAKVKKLLDNGWMIISKPLTDEHGVFQLLGRYEPTAWSVDA